MRPEFGGLDDTPRDLWAPLTMYGAVVGQELIRKHFPPGRAAPVDIVTSSAAALPAPALIIRTARPPT